MSTKDLLVLMGILGSLFAIGVFFMMGGPTATKMMTAFKDWYFGNETVITLVIKGTGIALAALFVYFIYSQFRS